MDLVLLGTSTTKAHPTGLLKLEFKKSLITRKKIKTYTRPNKSSIKTNKNRNNYKFQ